MADKYVHLAQAKHNEALATKLLSEPPYHDWAITAAFYAAVHYVETWLFDRREQHTETSIPVRDDGEFAHTAHVWREKLVERLGPDAHKAFRKLRANSEQARYLSLRAGASGSQPRWLPSPASMFFSAVDAGKMVTSCLNDLRWGLFGPNSP